MAAYDTVFAALAQDPDSPKRKCYGVVVCNRFMLTFYGAEETAPLRFRFHQSEYASDLAALQQARDILEAKQAKGYSTWVLEPNVLPVGRTIKADADPADLDLAIVWKKVWAKWTRGTKRSTPSPSNVPVDAKPTSLNAIAETYRSVQRIWAQEHDTATVDQRPATLMLNDTGQHGVRLPNGKVYYPRDLAGQPDVAVLRRLREHDIYARLYGTAGAGKTALAAAAFGEEMVTMQGHGDVTVAHFVGQYLPTEDGGFQWVDGPLTRAMKHGQVLLVDEITRIPPEALGVLFSVLDGRRVLVVDDRPDSAPIEAQSGFYVLATYNPEGVGVHGLDEAILSRFAFPIEVTTDYDSAAKMGVSGKVLRLVENLRTQNRQRRKNGHPQLWLPQMRELLHYQQCIRAGLGEAAAMAALIGQCPNPDDHDDLITAATHILGFTITPSRLGPQVV